MILIFFRKSIKDTFKDFLSFFNTYLNKYDSYKKILMAYIFRKFLILFIGQILKRTSINFRRNISFPYRCVILFIRYLSFRNIILQWRYCITFSPKKDAIKIRARLYWVAITDKEEVLITNKLISARGGTWTRTTDKVNGF